MEHAMQFKPVYAELNILFLEPKQATYILI